MKESSRKTSITPFLVAACMFFVLLFSASVSAESFKLSRMLPADYSFRTGLEINTKYYDTDSLLGVNYISQGQIAGVPIVEETNYWTGYRPFKDPEVEIGDTQPEVVYEENIPWRYAAIGGKGSNAYGDIDMTMVVLPRLQAKVVRKHDDNSDNYGLYATEYEYDDYGNVVKEINYGLVQDAYKDYTLQNQGYFSIAINSILTDFEGNLVVTDNSLTDQVVTETHYLYEDFIDDFDPAKCVGEHEFDCCWLVPSNCPIAQKYLQKNIYQLPTTIRVTNGVGRTLSFAELEYDGREDVNYVDCNPTDDCDNHAGSSDCSSPADDILLEAEDGTSHDYGCYSDGYGNYDCLRGSITEVSSYGGMGTSKTTNDGISLPINTIHYTKDSCGNMKQVSEAGVFFNPNVAGSHIDSEGKTAAIQYDSKLQGFPESVNVQGYEKTADYYYYGLPKTVTDENGYTVEYVYDELGRLKEVYDDLNPDDPIAEYYYYTPDPDDNKWKIRVDTKTGENSIATTYYIYDQLGRLIQTQSESSTDPYDYVVTDVKYDLMGRKKYESKPRLVNTVGGGFGTYESPFVPDWSDESLIKMHYIYDEHGRLVEIKNFDGDSSFTEYWIANNGADYTKAINERGKINTFYEDSRGNLVKVDQGITQ